MKIDSITLHQIRMPYVSPFQTSRWTETDHECVLVEARAEGLTGWGECVATRTCTYSYETVNTNWLILEEFILPAVFESSPDSVDAYRRALPHVTGHPMAKAGLEMALWDLLARRAGVSLQSFLGGSGDRVKVGVSVGIQPTTRELVEAVGRYVSQGYQRVKLKIKPGRDMEDVRSVRRAFPHLLLQVDANSAYRLGDAPHLKELDDFDLLLIEQPLDHDDILDHAKLQPQIRTPLCLDESVGSAVQARQALEIGACRIINIKPGRVSGLHEGRLIHDSCRAQDVPVWMGGMLETGLGRAANVALASLPGFTLHGDISASARYYARDIILEPFELNPDSTLSVPQGVGLGVTVDREALKEVTLRRVEFKGK
jgi:O-succinylbenzoate synthase